MRRLERAIPRNVLILAIVCGLGTPLAARSAQALSSTTGTSHDRRAQDQRLKQQVDQLQRELDKLKAEIRAEHSTSQPQAPTQIVKAEPMESPKPAFSTGNGIRVALHGFIDATMFSQNRSFSFGNGQNAELPITGHSGSLTGGDFRNTRFWLDLTGPALGDGWTGGGRIEMDFFGGFNGTGPFSRQQAIPRLRQAYVYLEHPSTGTTVKVGDQWDLIFPLSAQPTSLSHIAFPLGFGTGMIGWRFPGVVLLQSLNSGTSGIKLGMDIGVFDGNWNGPGDNVNFLTAGNAGFHPQVEARLTAKGDDWNAFAAIHYSDIELRGVGATVSTPIQAGFKSTAIEVGGKWTPGKLVIAGAGYAGRGIGELFGDLVQFGDIEDRGAYVQVGYHFTPHWSAYVFQGVSVPKKQDVVRWMGNGANGSLRGQQTAASVMYTYGPYDFGLGLLHAWLLSTTNGFDSKVTDGNQLSLSAEYHF